MNRRNRHVALFIRMLAIKEFALAKRGKKLLSAQIQAAARSYESSGLNGALAALQAGQSKWAKLFYSAKHDTFIDFSNYQFQQLASLRKTSFTERTSRYLRREALLKADAINFSTIRIIKRVIIKGNQAGLGQEGIAKLIYDKVGSSSLIDSRVRTIARTETHNAATYAMQEAAEETELKLVREWVSVSDDRTREAHADADGQQVGMDEPFIIDGEEIDIPGEGSPENSINCRCSIIYTPE